MQALVLARWGFSLATMVKGSSTLVLGVLLFLEMLLLRWTAVLHNCHASGLNPVYYNQDPNACHQHQELPNSRLSELKKLWPMPATGTIVVESCSNFHDSYFLQYFFLSLACVAANAGKRDTSAVFEPGRRDITILNSTIKSLVSEYKLIFSPINILP